MKESVLKMQQLNEGLGQDKIELNNIIMQMESERNQLWSAKQNLESERLGLRDELVRAEQEKMEVDLIFLLLKEEGNFMAGIYIKSTFIMGPAVG